MCSSTASAPTSAAVAICVGGFLLFKPVFSDRLATQNSEFQTLQATQPTQELTQELTQEPIQEPVQELTRESKEESTVGRFSSMDEPETGHADVVNRKEFSEDTSSGDSKRTESYNPDFGTIREPNRVAIDEAPIFSPTIAVVTGGHARFWEIMVSGAKQAAEDFDADVEVLMPTKGISDQERMVEELLTQANDGIAVSPMDPNKLNELLNRAAKRATLITFDSDAPETGRICFIGVDDYAAGLACGKLAREALPDGGKVAVFVGGLEQDNHRRRWQGTIDGLLGRKPDPVRFEPRDAEIKEAGYHIVGTYTDQFDWGRGRALAEEVISRHPDIDGMIGLFAYNPTLILDALKQADKLTKVKVIAFGEQDKTLQGIIDGNVYGTIVLNPFEYGRQSVRVLAGLIRGESLAELGVPESGFAHIPTRAITNRNVEQFLADLKKNLARE